MNRILLGLILSLLTTSAQSNVGTVLRYGGLVWDYPYTSDTNVHRFKVYVATTNDLPTVRDRLASIGEVPSLRWPVSSNLTSNLNGPYAVAVTAVADLVFTNLSGTNVTVTTNTVESDFSNIVSVNFRDGVPLPPTNVQLYSVVYAAATNSLPALPDPSAIPILPAMTPALKGPEYQLSGR